MAVVTLHTASVSFSLCYNESSSINLFTAAYLWVFTRFCVPVFIMITGALLLDPSKQVDLRKIYTNYVWRILTILGIVGFAYAAIEEIFTLRTLNLGLIPVCIGKVVSGDLWDHMWYLYMLIGLYMVLPLIKKFVNACTQTELDLFLVLLFVFNLLIPALENFVGLKVGVAFPITGSSIFYFIMGYRLMTIKSNTHGFTAVILVLFVLFLYALLHYDLNTPVKYLSFSSPIICIVSISVFLFFRNMDEKRIHAMFNFCPLLSNYSFGIYIFHPFFLNIITKVVKFNPMRWGGVSYVLVIATCILLSIMATYIYRKIPKIGKYL